MRKLLLLLLLLPFVVLGQEIPKGVTKIIITNTLSAKDNFNLVTKTLLDNDNFIEQSDSVTYYVKTQSKKPNKGIGLRFLNVRAMDNQVEISGMYKSGIEVGGIADNYEPIINRSGLYRNVFADMNALALKFGGTLSYR